MRHVPSPRLGPVLGRLATIGLTLLALSATIGLSSAQAETTTVSGQATLTLGSGKAGKALTKQKIKLLGVAPAKVKNLAGKRYRVTLKASQVTTQPTAVQVKGGIKFKLGKRTVIFKSVVIKVKGKTVTVTGKSAGRSLTLFTGKGKVSIETGVSTPAGEVDTVTAKSSGLKLTAAASKLLKKKLKPRKRIPAGAVGSLKLNVSKTTPASGGDPFLAQCGIAATSKVTGSLPAAAALPAMAGAQSLAAGTPDIAWGFKASFRGYMGGTGSLHAVNGAGRDGAGPIAGFTFPAKNGLYKANDTVNTGDDQLVLNGEGSAVFCNPGHGFRVAISNPTVVIDGASARIVADVDTNYFGIWTEAQRIDLAELDLDGISPFYNRSGSQISWQDIPATLTATGAAAFCEPASDDRPGQCLYSAGDDLDSITVKAETPYVTGAGNAAAWDALATYTKVNLAFPIKDRNIGGCDIPELSGGNRDQARTIDEYLGYNAVAETPANPPLYTWLADGDKPGAKPDMTGGTTVTGGGLDWGIIPGLRSSNSANGEFNLYGGATASSTYYGVGGTEPAPNPGYGQKQGAPTAFFTWPAATTAGTYKDEGGNRKLVLQTKGRVAICNTKLVNPFWMGYGTVISNPTVVIDGANSRITADIATRYRLSWVRGTVDVAKFNAADATVSENTAGGVTTVEWALPNTNDGKTKMTAAGSAVLRMLSKDYDEDSKMQNPTIRVSFPEGS